jgi:hypothetical protein
MEHRCEPLLMFLLRFQQWIHQAGCSNTRVDLLKPLSIDGHQVPDLGIDSEQLALLEFNSRMVQDLVTATRELVELSLLPDQSQTRLESLRINRDSKAALVLRAARFGPALERSSLGCCGSGSCCRSRRHALDRRSSLT